LEVRLGELCKNRSEGRNRVWSGKEPKEKGSGGRWTASKPGEKLNYLTTAEGRKGKGCIEAGEEEEKAKKEIAKKKILRKKRGRENRRDCLGEKAKKRHHGKKGPIRKDLGKRTS